MYYHCRELKYVEYGKIFPPPPEIIGKEMMQCYSWLGHYCGFCPQVWLSRSRSSITGFRNRGWGNQPKRDVILFGFDVIKGFNVDFNHWEFIMGSLLNNEKFEDQNSDIIKENNEIVDELRREKEPLDGELKEWVDCGMNLDIFLKKYLFVENDQVVVPSLNLKIAKKIICENEKQKKALRKMGFIEDRIIIKNTKGRKW